jgi:hypothetical protein
VGQKAEWAGWLLGRLGRKLGGIPFRNKIYFFEFTKALEIVQGDLGENLMWRYFQNSSMIFKDFRKI